MEDNIRNFSDYRKKVNLEKQETEEISIEIQDPLDFLTDSERKEYYESQHEAMDRERNSLDENSPEYYFDDEKIQNEKKIPDESKETGETHKRKPLEEDKDSSLKGKTARRENSRKEKEPIRENTHKEKEPIREKREKNKIEDEEWFDEDEGREDKINPYLLVRIASVVTGIVVLVFIGMLFKVKIYDVYLKPDPDEISTSTSVGEIEGYTYTNDTVTTTTTLNLRNTPSTASDEFIFVQVPEGTVLERVAVSDDGTWAQVKYDNNVLYCVMKYLKVNEE